MASADKEKLEHTIPKYTRCAMITDPNSLIPKSFQPDAVDLLIFLPVNYARITPPGCKAQLDLENMFCDNCTSPTI